MTEGAPPTNSSTIQVDSKILWQSSKSIIWIGSLVFLLFFGVFIGWASFAPLYGAAISPGIVSVESNRKQIQHFEGGIIREILVSDGDVVDAGEVLIRLSETQSKANLDLLQWRQTVSQAEEGRLIDERNDNETLTETKMLSDEGNLEKYAEIVATQKNIFSANRNALVSQTAILNQRIGELGNEIEGLTAQIEAEKTQLFLIGQEITDVTDLVDKGLAPKPRLSALQRAQADLKGSNGKNRSLIARAKQTIGATNLQKEDLILESNRRIASELKEVQSDLLDVEEQIRAAEDIQSRIEIRAPLAGTIVNKQVFTEGGVISPGQMVMEIVPLGDRLIVEAMVSPKDIDEVSVGLPARVRFSAFSQRRSQPIEGKVISVSADRIVNKETGQDYFLARVELDVISLKELGEEVLVPGMKAEVFVVTKTRTLMSYLLEPLTQGIERGLRE